MNLCYCVFAANDLWAGVNTSVAGDDDDSHTHLGIAWFQVTPSLQTGQLSATIRNQGYVTVGGENVIFPSIGVNQNGQAAAAFTLVSGRRYPTESARKCPREGWLGARASASLRSSERLPTVALWYGFGVAQ